MRRITPVTHLRKVWGTSYRCPLSKQYQSTKICEDDLILWKTEGIAKVGLDLNDFGARANFPDNCWALGPQLEPQQNALLPELAEVELLLNE